jgi:cytochrome c biogenesis protein
MFDPAMNNEIAHRFALAALGEKAKDDAIRNKFEDSIKQLLKAFSQGGYTTIAKVIEKSVPAAERDKAAQTYLKIIAGSAYEAYTISQEKAGLKPSDDDSATQLFLQDSLNAMSDLFFYGTPFYLQMTDFEQRQASGLQLTRSPGKNLVYSGSILLVLGIFSMIFIRERRIWLLVKPDNRILFAMSANRRNRDLDIEFDQYQQQIKRMLEDATT